MAYELKDKWNNIWIIDDKLIRKFNNRIFVLDCKAKMGDDLYINYYLDVEYYRQATDLSKEHYAEVEGSGTEFGYAGEPVAYYEISMYKHYYKKVYNETTGLTDLIAYHELNYKFDAISFPSWKCTHVIHNNNIYKYEFWIPDTVVNVNIDMAYIYRYANTGNNIVHIGKNVKLLFLSNSSKIVKDDDAVNTSLEKLSTFIRNGHHVINDKPVIKLRNCVNLDYIHIDNDSVDGIDLYVDKKYKSLSKKKWTHDNCLVTEYDNWDSKRPLAKLDWKKLFNRSISDEADKADNFMCVQTDEAVVQIPLYMVQDGQSIDVDNALLIKEDDGVYYCPVTKEKTDKSIMAIQSTDCVYYIDSE